MISGDWYLIRDQSTRLQRPGSDWHWTSRYSGSSEPSRSSQGPFRAAPHSATSHPQEQSGGSAPVPPDRLWTPTAPEPGGRQALTPQGRDMRDVLRMPWASSESLSGTPAKMVSRVGITDASLQPVQGDPINIRQAEP